MKCIKSIISVLLIISVLFSLCLNFSVNAEKPEIKNSALTSEDFLTSRGRKIVNQKGEEVILRGVNLGAWLIFEDWLCPYEEVSDNFEVVETLTERFGREKAYELLNTYYDNFITEYDLDNIKSMGFNAVRVPFWFRNFYYDDKGTKILDSQGNWNLSRLDWIVEKCTEKGLYIVLDMHGAVGYQSDAPHSGKGKSCGLYDDSTEGENYRVLTEELWREMATRYKDCPAVAMYDLLNEPMCDCECTEITRRINNEMIYTRLYNAVREVDKNHLISVECIWTAAAVPHKAYKGWENVVYQVHFYQNTNFIFNLFVYLTRLYYMDSPMMMGEFYPHKICTWENCFNTMERCKISWFLWTYKATGHGMWESDWCLMGSKDGFERAKIKTDSFEEIQRKWGECQRTEVGYQDSGHYRKDVEKFLK